jgi:AAHS family 4-hydroxybenzoate transporter-like MFS transporter
VEFTEELQRAPFGARQRLVMTSLGLLVLFDGMDTQMLGVVAHDMTHDLGLPISTFGIIFAIGLLGGVAGSLVMSPVADRWLGRKAIAVAAMLVAGLSTLATPSATGLASLLVLRFVTGLGLGAALPSIFTLVGEFAPRRLARPITACLTAFMPLGSLLGGLLARAVVPNHGWAMLLYAGGALTLALTALAAAVLPESVHFLLHIKRDAPRALEIARAYLSRPSIRILHTRDEGAQGAKKPIRLLFASGLWKLTALLWVAFILNQGMLYFVLSWTPALLQKSGLANTVGMDAASMFGIGGAIGTAAQGLLAKRFDIFQLMLLEIALFVAAILALPFVLTNAVLAPGIVFFVAFGICAYHSGFILLVTESYPENARTTGFGWALGIGRIGATGAPVIAGALVAAGWTPGQVFDAAALPALISAGALIGITLLFGRRAERVAAHVRADAGQPMPRVQSAR